MHWQFGEMEFGEMKGNTSNWSNFGMLLRRAGLTASAGLSCISYLRLSSRIAEQVQIKMVITLIIAQCTTKILSFRGDWYLLRAKFTDDSNILVCEIGRGRGVEERSLEIAKVLWGSGRR